MSVSSVVGAVAGGVVGFLIGGPAGALYGAAFGLGLGSIAGGMPGVEGPRLSDLSIQTSTYGTDIPRVYSTITVAGNVLWLENNKLREVKSSSGGGKGGGGGGEVDTYTYYATFHLGLCEGPILGIRRIWCSDKLLYDAGSDDLETIIAGNTSARSWTLYNGSDDQQPTSRYEADVGAGNATGHRGLAYIEFRDFNLSDYGNTLEGAQFKIELVTDQAIQAPSYMFDRPMVGEVVYSDDATVQTAVANTGYVQNDVYYGSVTFLTYNPKGRLIRTRTKRASVPIDGTTSLAFYRSLPLRGVANSMFVYRASGTPTCRGDIVGDVVLATPSADKEYVRTSWGDLLPTVGGVILHRNGAFSSIALPFGWSSQAAAFIESESRLFIRTYNVNTLDAIVGEFDPNSFSVLWSQVLGTGGDWGASNATKSAIYGGRMLTHIGDSVRLYQINESSVIQISALPLSGRSNCYRFATGFGITAGGKVYQMTDRAIIGNETLSDIVERECARSGLLSLADIDASALAQDVRGYRISGGSIRSSLDPLSTAFQFDMIQDGYKLKAVPRGQSSVLTVPYEDLGATTSDTPSDVFKIAREMDSQLPARTTIKYLEAAREYDIGEQYAERINTEAVNKVDIELPIVLTPDEAAGVSEVLQSRAWLERNAIEFTLPPDYLALQPCDVITAQTPGASYEVIINEIEYTPEGRLQVKARPSAASVYTPNAAGGEGEIPAGTIGVAGPSLFVPLDIPVVDETYQNQLGFVGVMTGYTDGWPGGVLYRSPDRGQTWTDIEPWQDKCTIGTAFDALAAHDGYLIDQSELAVLVVSGELESVTSDQMISGSNYAAYGADGRWEIVRFQDATLESDGSYTLSNFVRGDKGTEWATGLHEVGDWFILLSDPENVFITMATESLTLDLLYRGITNRETIDSGEDVEFTYRGVNLEPLSTVDASATRDGSGSLSATFTRRSRLTSSWWSTGVVAPVGEYAEAYEIDVMDGSSVVRTIAASSPAFSYSSADQTTDFGSPQASITFRIYQLSDIVGRGYAREVTL